MKTTTLFIAALFILQAGTMFAANEGSPSPVGNEAMVLAPVTPAEATFEEMESTFFLTTGLAPVTPLVADFDDAIETAVPDNAQLAPVTPAEADFE